MLKLKSNSEKLTQLATATALALLLVAPASADIVGGNVTGGSAFTAGGTFVKLTVPLTGSAPPNTVGNDNFQSPNLYGFNEDQNILLAAPLSVDVGASLTIAAGTVVASHYIFFDPGPGQNIIGTVDFDSDVLAIITSTGLLSASDFLVNTGVNYLNPGLRGLEPGDSATISGTRQIRFATSASSPGDYIRVLTEYSPNSAVPEPGSIVLLGGILCVLGAPLHRRVRRAMQR